MTGGYNAATGHFTFASREAVVVDGRALHSFTFQLNLSASCGIGGAFRGGVWDFQEVLGGNRGCLGYVLCQKRLRLS